MFRLDFADIAFYSVMIFLAFVLVVGIVMTIIGDKECAVWGEPKARTGFIVVGKTTVPTTYQARECLVYKEK